MKKLVTLLLAALLLLANAVPAYAAVPETAVPFYANTSQASVSFVIQENGHATWSIYCIGKTSCTGIDAVTYLERQVGNDWVRVDLENADDEYTYSTTVRRMAKTYEATLSISGTYRAVVEFTVYGTNEDETITLWNEHDYGV